MKSEKLWIYGLAAVGVGILGLELSRYNFGSGTREKITTRDKHYCQVEGCNNKDVTSHHLIPESCLNNETYDGGDKYVDEIRALFEEVSMNLGDLAPAMHSLWSQFIKKSPQNGICLCSYHHTNLHKDDFFTDDQLRLKTSIDHPYRPASLTITDVSNFLLSVNEDLYAKASSVSQQDHA